MVLYSPEVEALIAAVRDFRKEIHKIPGVSATGITHSDITGITGTGVGYQLAIYLEEFNLDLINSLPRIFNGVGIVIKVSGKATAVGCTRDSCGCHCSPSGTFNQKYRPIQPGAGIENISARDRPCAPGGSGGCCRVGTLGWVAYTQTGEPVILSNNHVIAYDYPGFRIGKAGDPIIQPGALDSGSDCTDQIGKLANWIPIADPMESNKVDCAYATINSGIGYNYNSLCDFSILPSFNSVEPSVGMKIKKSGRTTGCTSGSVEAIDFSVTVGYDYGNADFVDQFKTSPDFNAAGDSGSLVVVDEGDPCHATGLLFAGYSDGSAICNRISEVEKALGISVNGWCTCSEDGTTCTCSSTPGPTPYRSCDEACKPPPPPPPPEKRYGCSGYRDDVTVCSEWEMAPYKSCEECIATLPLIRRTCSGAPDYICEPDEDGSYVDLDACKAGCISPTPKMYRCTGSPDFACVEDPAGGYDSLDACKSACTGPARYRCTGAPDYSCVKDPDGAFDTLKKCNDACLPPGCTKLLCSMKFI